MNKKWKLLLLLALVGLAYGCNKPDRSAPVFAKPFEAKVLQEMAPPREANVAAAEPPPSPSGSANSAQQRFRAIRQYLTLEMPASALQAAWQSANDECNTQSAQCEILISSISQGEAEVPASATLHIRIAPQRQSDYRRKLLTSGELREDRTESEDKTSEVVDTEAKLKNTQALRDRLRTMLNSPGAKLKDLIDLEKELARAQSALDSLTGIRKALANETEKISMQIEFRAKRSVTEAGTFRPITEAFSRSGRIFSESISELIVFVVGGIPWLLLFAAFFYVIYHIVRKLQRRKTNARNSEEDFH